MNPPAGQGLDGRSMLDAYAVDGMRMSHRYSSQTNGAPWQGARTRWLFVLVAVFVATAPVLHAQQEWRAYWENDTWRLHHKTDRAYTNGMSFSTLGCAPQAPWWVRVVGPRLTPWARRLIRPDTLLLETRLERVRIEALAPRRDSLSAPLDSLTSRQPSDSARAPARRVVIDSLAIRNAAVSSEYLGGCTRDGRGHSTRQRGWTITQTLYTPSHIQEDPPDTLDRPYGAWLYYGSLFQALGSSGKSLHSYELDIGLIGPGALGNVTQSTAHTIIGVGLPKGWKYQIKSQLGLDILYNWERSLVDVRSRCGMRLLDISYEANGAVGNVFTYAGTGALARVGYNMSAHQPGKIGPVKLPPECIDESRHPTNSAHKFELYVYGGLTGRATAENIFLDAASPRIQKNVFVGDKDVGLVIGWNGWEGGWRWVDRSREFRGQDFANKYGSILIGHVSTP